MTVLAADSSVAVPLLLRSHRSHAVIAEALHGIDLALTAHSLAETYSVLTRLPGDARLLPEDAERALTRRFVDVLVPEPGSSAMLAAVLAPLGIHGGATFDALVALAARDHGVPLASRDARAAPTYGVLGVQVVPLPG